MSVLSGTSGLFFLSETENELFHLWNFAVFHLALLFYHHQGGIWKRTAGNNAVSIAFDGRGMCYAAGGTILPGGLELPKGKGVVRGQAKGAALPERTEADRTAL